jgi:hypothetical protein
MDLNGEEKRIRALFRELRCEDTDKAPLFAREWARAQSRAAQRGKRFGLLRVAAVLVVICVAVVATVLLSKQKQQRNVANQMVASPTTERQLSSKGEVVVQKAGEPSKPQNRSPVRRRLARKSPEARHVFPSQRRGIELSRWRSPTASLLSSAGDRLLRSFPRVDQSSREFRLFLPDRPN